MELTATTQTAASSSVAIASEPASQRPRTGHGRSFHASSVSRVCAMPLTSTRSDASTRPASARAAVGARSAALALAGCATAVPEAQLRHEQRRLDGDPRRHLRRAELAIAEDDRQLDDLEAARARARFVSSTWKA